MSRRLLATLLPIVILLSGCSSEADKPAARHPSPGHLVEVRATIEEKTGYQLERIGTLRAEREIRVLVQEEGRLLELPFREGERVKRGAPLLRLDDSVLQAELRKSSAQRRQAELDLNRLQRLQGQKLVSEEELARAQTALDVARSEEELLRVRLGYTRIKAPFDGVIRQRLAEPGDILARFDHVLTLTDLQSLITEVSVSELLLPGLSVGDAVDVRIDALPRQVLAGRILRIHPAIDAVTRQGRVDVTLQPSPDAARPGQLARLTLRTQPADRKLVPFSALRVDQQGEHVFRVSDENRVERIAVRSGIKLGDSVEILGGLAVNDRVVIKGFSNLSHGKTIRIVNTAPPATAPGPARESR